MTEAEIRQAWAMVDFDALFNRVCFEMVGEACAEHGLDVITEEQLEYLVAGVTDTVHRPALGQMRRELGLSTVPRATDHRVGWRFRF